MARAHALIVDDSRTAQIRLKKMLGDYALDVDVAFSAEEALDYLSHHKPAVVFLDHHMEGMDGFEALKVIKANPDTAMIPVIMYTAQKGDVYSGQALALGAIDILSKEIMKPASLQASLKLLHIEPGKALDRAEKEAERLIDAEAPMEKPLAPVVNLSPTSKKSAVSHGGLQYQNAGSSYSSKKQPSDEGLSEHIAYLFEVQGASLRNHVKESSQLLFRRLRKEIENAKLGKPSAPLDDELDEGDIDLEHAGSLEKQDPDKTAILKLMLVFSLIGLVALGVYVLRINHKIDVLSTAQQNAITDSVSNQQILQSIRDSQLQLNAPAQVVNDLPLLDTLAWAIDLNLTFGFQEPALSASRVKVLEELVEKLSYSGFQGIISIDVHLGNFCVEQGLDGRYALAAPDTPLAQCQFVEDLALDYTASDFISDEYINFEQSSAPIQSGKLDAQIFFTGYAQPREAYPNVTSTMTAGQWNAVAQKNNRIAVSFI